MLIHKKDRRFNLSRGFTLVELLVVIAIIGVLSTLLLLQLNVARAKARDAKRVADINQVRSAMELYYDDMGYYPSPNTGLNTKLANYLTKLPNDPGRTGCVLGTYDGPSTIAAGCYGYAYNPTGNNPTKFHLWAELEQKATSALGNDLDFDSTLTWTDGARVNGTVETCADSAAIDCVYDVGQPN